MPSYVDDEEYFTYGINYATEENAVHAGVEENKLRIQY
jgi:hypothetical protein